VPSTEIRRDLVKGVAYGYGCDGEGRGSGGTETMTIFEQAVSSKVVLGARETDKRKRELRRAVRRGNDRGERREFEASRESRKRRRSEDMEV
jgi:hypothetical protein